VCLWIKIWYILITVEIKYLGWQSFRIQEGRSVVLTQPFSQRQTGVIFPKTKANVVLPTGKTEKKTQERVLPLNHQQVFWVPGPGEYEVGGVEIQGFEGGFWFKMRRFELVFCWQWAKEAIKKVAADFPTIDILLIMGERQKEGFARKIKKVVEKISPSLVIPFSSASLPVAKLKSGQWSKPFLDVFDQEDVKPADKLSLAKEEIGEENLKIVLLRPRV